MSTRTKKLLALKYNIEMLLEADNGGTLSKLRSFVQKKPESEGMWKHIIKSIGSKLSSAASSLKKSIFGHLEAEDDTTKEKILSAIEKIKKDIDKLKNQYKNANSYPTFIKLILFGFVLYSVAKIITYSKEVASKLPSVISGVKNSIVKSFSNLFDSKKPLADRVFDFISNIVLAPFEVAFKSLPDHLFRHLLNVGALTFGAAIVMLIFRG